MVTRQSNPKAAKELYSNDKDVQAFLMEFGRVMGSHFEAIGEKTASSASTENSTKNRTSSASTAVSSPVTEIGPLQAQALKNAKQSYVLD